MWDPTSSSLTSAGGAEKELLLRNTYNLLRSKLPGASQKGNATSYNGKVPSPGRHVPL